MTLKDIFYDIKKHPYCFAKAHVLTTQYMENQITENKALINSITHLLLTKCGEKELAAKQLEEVNKK